MALPYALSIKWGFNFCANNMGGYLSPNDFYNHSTCGLLGTGYDNNMFVQYISTESVFASFVYNGMCPFDRWNDADTVVVILEDAHGVDFINATPWLAGT